MQTHGGKSLDSRAWFHARLIQITLELAQHEIVLVHGLHALEYFHALIAQSFHVRIRRRLHGNVADDLHQVVLDDVADGAHSVIKRAAALNAKAFGHGDLDAFYILAVPDGFKKKICKAEEDDFLDGIFSEVMVNAKDILFAEDTVDFRCEGARRFKIVAEGFFYNDTRAIGASGIAELINDAPKENGRNRQLVQGTFASPSSFLTCWKVALSL